MLLLRLQWFSCNDWKTDKFSKNARVCVCVCIFPGGSAVKILPAMQERQVRSLGWEDPPGVGNGNPLQYSFFFFHSSILVWRIPMDRGAWQAIVHGLAKSWTRLKQLSARVCVCVCVCARMHTCAGH